MIKIEQLENVTTKALEELNVLIPQVSRNGKALTYAYLVEMLKDNNAMLFLVKDGGKIIGMGTLVFYHTINGKRGDFEHIVIDENYRGQGLGEKLCKKLIEVAKEQKLGQLSLTSNNDRVAAHKLYQKLGFEKRDTNVFRLKL